MASITFDRFDVGLDSRKGKSVADANRMRVLTNAYVTTGRAIRKRPGLTAVAELEAGTVGLRAGGGVLNTFYGVTPVAHANPLFLANKIAHPTPTHEATKIHYADMFLGFLYVSAEYDDGSIKHHYLDGSATTFIADVNCPNTAAVIKAANHVFAIGRPPEDTVRFSAAGAPKNWTAASDAGFLPVGQNQDGAGQAYALGQFQKELVVYFSDGAQIWTVDENPTLNAINQKIFGVGTKYPRSPASFATDNFFLADIGYRSITLNTVTDNKQDSDVGSPIDDFVVPLLPEIGTIEGVMDIYASGLGQFWGFIGSTAWVYSFSKSAKIAAWSKYTFPFAPDDVTQLNNTLYLRFGNLVYKLDKSVFTDNGQAIAVEIEMPYVDAKKSGILKMFTGFDAVVTGTGMLSVRFDPRNEALITSEVEISDDTRPGEMTPIEITAEAIAPRITHAADEAFQLDLLQFYFFELGPT